MQIPKEIFAANEVIARSMVDGGLGREDGMPRYQWRHSSHIQMPVADRELSEDGTWYTVFDYWCGCGKNVRVHAPSCQTLTEAKARWHWENLVKGLDDHWVLCRWLPPTIWGDERKWSSMFWGAPFPSKGFYLPTTSIGSSGRHISVPNSSVGLEAFDRANRIVIKAFQLNSETTGKEENKKFEAEYKANQKKMKEDWKYKFKSAMSCNIGGAGKKGDWVSFNLDGSKPTPPSSSIVVVGSE